MRQMRSLVGAVGSMRPSRDVHAELGSDWWYFVAVGAAEIRATRNARMHATAARPHEVAFRPRRDAKCTLPTNSVGVCGSYGGCTAGTSCRDKGPFYKRYYCRIAPPLSPRGHPSWFWTSRAAPPVGSAGLRYPSAASALTSMGTVRTIAAATPARIRVGAASVALSAVVQAPTRARRAVGRGARVAATRW